MPIFNLHQKDVGSAGEDYPVGWLISVLQSQNWYDDLDRQSYLLSTAFMCIASSSVESGMFPALCTKSLHQVAYNEYGFGWICVDLVVNQNLICDVLVQPAFSNVFGPKRHGPVHCDQLEFMVLYIFHLKLQEGMLCLFM